MQKRIWLSGAPHWIGVYSDEPGEWVVIGEVREQLISATGYSEKNALDQWKAKAIKALSRRT